MWRHAYLHAHYCQRPCKRINHFAQCDPKLWDQKSEKAYGKGEFIKELNNHVATLKVKVFEARLSLIESNRSVTAESIKNMLIGKVEKSKTILKVFRNHNEQIAVLLNSDYALSTLKKYETALK